MLDRITLGTAQFGLDYGISNKIGQIPYVEIKKILDYAYSQCIDTLDTAQLYGNSEEVIGKYIKDGHKFNIVTKLSERSFQNVEKSVEESLLKLNVSSLYGVLFHDFDFFFRNQKAAAILMQLKDRHLIQKIGFSLYHTHELKYLLDNNITFDLIQIPYNIFDRRFEPFFKTLFLKDIEIHIRSIFLQGLIFIEPDKLPAFFIDFKKKLTDLKCLAKKYNVTPSTVCTHFVLKNRYINKIVLGIDSLSNLKENISAIRNQDFMNLWDEKSFVIDSLMENDEKFILPYNWIIE